MKNNYIILNINMSFGNTVEIIHPVLIREGNNNILVDCGFIGSLPLIEEELSHHGIDPGEIAAVVLTHHDHDHMGAAAAFKQKYPQARFCASALEEAYISARVKPLRLAQAEELQEELPPEHRDFGRAFCELLRRVEPVPVDVLLHDSDLLPGCGYRVVATPGHTPGHISLYDEASGIIIAGDAMALENGEPVIANPQFTLDPEEASASMAKLLAMNANKIICHHGGVYVPSPTAPVSPY